MWCVFGIDTTQIQKWQNGANIWQMTWHMAMPCHMTNDTMTGQNDKVKYGKNGNVKYGKNGNVKYGKNGNGKYMAK